MKPLTRNILSAAWMESSFPRRGPRRSGTSPATVRSRVPTTNPLTTRCVARLLRVAFPLGGLLFSWAPLGSPGADCLSFRSPGRQPVCQRRCSVSATGQHRLHLASKLGNRRRKNTLSSPKTAFVTCLYHTARHHEP